MSLLQAICPGCGGPLEETGRQGQFSCRYCKNITLIDDPGNRSRVARITRFMRLAKEAERGGRRTEACRYYIKILELDPDDPYAWAGRAVTGDISLAPALIQTALERGATTDPDRLIRETTRDLCHWHSDPGYPAVRVGEAPVPTIAAANVIASFNSDAPILGARRIVDSTDPVGLAKAFEGLVPEAGHLALAGVLVNQWVKSVEEIDGIRALLHVALELKLDAETVLTPLAEKLRARILSRDERAVEETRRADAEREEKQSESLGRWLYVCSAVAVPAILIGLMLYGVESGYVLVENSLPFLLILPCWAIGIGILIGDLAYALMVGGHHRPGTAKALGFCAVVAPVLLASGMFIWFLLERVLGLFMWGGRNQQPRDRIASGTGYEGGLCFHPPAVVVESRTTDG